MAPRISKDEPPAEPQPLTASVAGGAKGAPESRLDRIARRAHDLYEARGGAPGNAVEDWLQAEREIDEAE